MTTSGEADAASGLTIGIKVVPFARKTDAYVYFVQKYMQGMVGRPRVVPT